MPDLEYRINYREPNVKAYLDAIRIQEEILVTDVLRNFLQRTPVIRDKKKCLKAMSDLTNTKYSLRFEGVTLGNVTIDIENNKILFAGAKTISKSLS